MADKVADGPEINWVPPSPPPGDVSEVRWRRYRADVAELIEREPEDWLLRAAVLGWSYAEVFAPGTGLAWVIAGGKLIALDHAGAIIEHTAVDKRTVFRREHTEPTAEAEPVLASEETQP